MRDTKKGCCTARNCPCYPNCDQMMSDNWMGQRTEKREQESLDLSRLDRDETELMKLAEQDEKDLEKLKELYPVRIRQILSEIEKVCDTMEYEGSIMFDELPEKQRILELKEGIREKVEPQIENWEQEEERQQEEDIYVMDHRNGPGQMRHPQPPGPQRPGRPPQPPFPPQSLFPPKPPRQTDWFGDLIQVLLQDEMYHRRCRRRNCRKW